MDLEKLEELLHAKSYAQLKRELVQQNQIDLAEWMDSLSSKDTLLVFRMLPKDLAAEVFSELGKEQRKELINTMTQSELSEVLDELYFNEMIDVLEEVPAIVVSKVLANSTPQERRLINQFLKYPEDSAGSEMTIEYVELHPQMTVKEALEQIKDTGLTRKTVYTCYVTDNRHKLIGFVSLRELIVAKEDQLVDDIKTDNVVSVEAHQDKEEVAQTLLRYGFLALPVVDSENRLVGIITVDDVMDIMEEEATEDFQLMGATTPTESAYLETTAWTMAKNCLGWLMILMFSSTLSAWVINTHSAVLDKMIILNTFIPMIIDTGGNTGSQSSTLIIRALATGDVVLKDAVAVVWKEFRIALLCGITLSVVNFFRLNYIGHTGALISLSVSITILAVVMLAKIIGACLPLIAKKVGLDPALMAGPLITTIVDAMGLLVYFAVIGVVLP
ncbi:MAG: magnesium transporter [Tissierellia bacterium]|nr:magnesium transporter [Tissierellia bacterium]